MKKLTDTPVRQRSGVSEQQGFTLLELLIAVAIFALIGLAGYRLLNSVIRTYEQTRERADSFGQLQQAVSVIEQDLKQLTRRTVRDELGDALPAFSARYRGGLPLEFTRTGGWVSDPDPTAGSQQGSSPSLAQSGVKQRIGYRLQDGQLQRLVWPVLDRAEDTEPRIQPLLEDVQDLSVRMLAENGTWQTFWPVENSEGQLDFNRLPKGVEVGFRHKVYGRIKRIFAREGL